MHPLISSFFAPTALCAEISHAALQLSAPPPRHCPLVSRQTYSLWGSVLVRANAMCTAAWSRGVRTGRDRGLFPTSRTEPHKCGC